MGRRINIDIKEMLDKIQQLIITQEDCGYIFKTKDKTDEFYRLYKLYQQGNYNIKLIEDFLIDNSDDINKENLMLVLAKNCKYQILGIEEQLREEEKRQVTSDKEVKMKMTTISVGNKQKRMIEETLKYVQQNAKGMDKILTFYRQDNEKKTYTLDVADSRELIDKKHVSSVRNLKRFEKIDNAFDDDKDNIGIGYILQVINLSDLKEIFPSFEEDDDESEYIEESETEKIARESKKKRFGIDVMRLIYDRKILREGILSYEELKEIKHQYPEKYNQIIDTMKNDNFTPYIKEVVREYIKYVDIDKLLLIAAYRFNYGLEGIEDKRQTTGYEEIIKIILNNIENSKAELFCNLEYEWDGKLVMAEAEYSVEKLKRFASKFVDNQYISEREIKISKEKILNKELLLKDIEPRYIDIMFSQEDLKEYASLNIENFEFVAEKLNWDRVIIIGVLVSQTKISIELLKNLIEKQKIDIKDILSLYMNGNISLEQVEELKEKIDLSNAINSYELIQYYNNSIQNDSNEENKNEFERYVDIFKQIGLKTNSEEMTEKYDELVNTLLDNYQGEKYIKAAQEFYQKGLLTLEVLVEWNEEKIIERFYKDDIITIEDIEDLVRIGKLPLQYITDLYMELIHNVAKDDMERMEYLKKGYIGEKEIFDLYNQNLIYLHQLEDLASMGVVRQAHVDRIKANADKELKELNANSALFYISNIYKKNNKIYSDRGDREDKEYETEEEKKRYIIDPNERQEFFRLFNMGIVPEEARKIDIDSPFYNYEFYAIPDESGDIGLNSVILAERYYEDRTSEERFALDNATYLFRYDDFLVLTKLEKSDLTKEKVVFTASHTVATDNRNGSWALSVIYGIVKTMLSDDLKGYSKSQRRMKILDKLNEMYSQEQVLEILEMASRIDRGDYTYEVVNPEDEILRKIVTKKEEKNITDDDSGLR